MSDTFTFHEGDTPLLISVPHDGWQLPTAIVQYMSDAGRRIADTDWYVSDVYEFAKTLGASMIVARNSRYVVDLNRPADDAKLYPGQLATGLCPLQTFAGEDIYLEAIDIDVDDRVRQYWRPYHQKLAATLDELRALHGYALLWDAHSIASQVPRLFDGELPVLNVGTWDGKSCGAEPAAAVFAAAEASDYSATLNGRFKGGYITRHYGDPANNTHAVQLELAQRAYMDEGTLELDRGRAAALRDTLEAMLTAYLDTVKR